MPNTLVTKAEFNMLARRVEVVEEENKSTRGDLKSLAVQVGEFKGNFETAIKNVNDRIKDAGERSDRHATKLEELFIQQSEKLQDIVEQGQKEQKDKIKIIIDTLDLEGHSDNPYLLKTFLRAAKQERNDRQQNQLEIKKHSQKERVSLAWKIVGYIALMAVGSLGTFAVSVATKIF